ncbi:MAG: helix-turn-helix domain-containing protein [Candidatus Hodarchaeales archaeon]|jgi:sugar-specific transcriptional regulator TrmB
MATLGLESLDLNFQESKIYLLLLALGPLSLGEVIKHAEFSLEDALKSLEGLKKKGYVHDISGIALRFQALIPFDDLKTSAETTISQMEDLANRLDEHISQKLSIILGKLREEASKINEGLGNAQTAINQAEMKVEGDIEERIARYTLDVEQGIDQAKNDITKTFETKQSENQALISNLKEIKIQKVNEMGTKFRDTNQQLFGKYQGGIDELQASESQRNQTLTNQVDSLISQSQNSFTQGIQDVHQSMDATGQSLFQSIDERNEKLNTHITSVTTEMAAKVSKVSEDNQLKVVSSLESCNETFQKQLNEGKQDAIGIFASARDEIKSKSVGSTQNLQQTINETLVTTQNQLVETLQQTQETMSQRLAEARDKVENSLTEFSEAVKIQTDSDVEKIVIKTESTFGGLVQDTQTTSETTREEITAALNEMTTDAKKKTEETKGAALIELNGIVKALKTEINSHLEQFKQTLIPQEQFLKDELGKFRIEFTSSRTQALETLKNMMEEFKAVVSTNHQEIEAIIVKETSTLLESINQFVEELNGQVKDYDNKYSEILAETAVKGSERLIVQTRELQEKMVNVANEMSKTATNTLTATNELIASSIQAEISTFETELNDYTTKFKEVSQQNEEVFKNYLFSLGKLSSLVIDTKHPEVQTAPIHSQEAVLNYIDNMFSRMKGRMTLLIPNVNDIPYDMILGTKNHQGINLVSVIDPTTHSDKLKRLFSKPNVKVKRVDTTKFEGVERYIAADRDGEEVIIGLVEDQGETMAIASHSEAFVTLMGKIVLGDYFLARSQEISRTEVGM